MEWMPPLNRRRQKRQNDILPSFKKKHPFHQRAGETELDQFQKMFHQIVKLRMHYSKLLNRSDNLTKGVP
jgi:hypothetical protein